MIPNCIKRLIAANKDLDSAIEGINCFYEEESEVALLLMEARMQFIQANNLIKEEDGEDDLQK